MRNLFDYLYAYLTNEKYESLNAWPDYQEAEAEASAAQAALLGALSEEQQELFFSFLEKYIYEAALEQEYIVREALSLGLREPTYFSSTTIT